MSKIDLDITNLPDTTVSVRDVFGIDTDLRVPAQDDVEPLQPCRAEIMTAMGQAAEAARQPERVQT